MLYKSLPLPMLFLLWPTSGECKWVTLAERRSTEEVQDRVNAITWF